MINVKRLEQVIVEDLSTRQGIRELVSKDIKNSIDTTLSNIYNKLDKTITDWLNEPIEFNSQARLRNKLKLIPSSEIAVEMMIAVARTMNRRVAIQGVIDTLARSFEWDTEHLLAVKAAGELMGVCVDTELYDLELPGHSGQFIMLDSLITLDQETMDQIEMTQYPMPLICVPKNWSNNRDGGYYSIKSSVLLGRHENHHEENVCLDVLNILQNISYSLDENMLDYAEIPNKELDTREKKDAFNHFTNLSDSVYEYLYENNNEFYFTYRVDTRGRNYCSGYHVTLQGSKFKKSIVNFTKKQLITD